jgi:MFS family permease
MLTERVFKSHTLQGVVVCLAASLFFAYELMQLHMLNAITPMLMTDLHFTATDLGILGSTYIMADVLFLLPAGMILDRFSVRKVILVALGFCILGTIGFAYSNTLFQACVSHFFSGIGNAFCFLSCMLLCFRWFDAKRHAFIMGSMLTMGMLGAVLAQTPFSLLAEYFSWRQALVFDAFIGFGIFLAVYFFVIDAKNTRDIKLQNIPLLEGITRSIKNLHNISCGLYTGMMNLPLMLLGAMWGSLYLTQVHGMKLIEASFVTSMISMGTIVGAPLVGFISDKLKNRASVMLVGAVLSLGIFCYIVLTQFKSPELFSVLFFLLGLTTSTQVLGYPAITENNPPELSGTAMGIAGMIIMGSALVLQPVSGMLIDLNWDGTMLDGIRLYAHSDFLLAFSMFPVGFIASIFIANTIKDKSTVEAPA